MDTKASKRWRRWAGYPAFFLASFLLCLYLTFPYDALQARLQDEARKGGYALDLLHLGPGGFLGVTAKGVSLSPARPKSEPGAPPAPGLTIDAITARPALLPPGIHLDVKAFGGEVSALVSAKGKGGVALSDVNAKRIDVSRAGLKALYGVDATGLVNADAGDLVVNLAEIAKSKGSIKLTGKDLTLSGSVPKASLGNLELRLKVEPGKATIEKLAVTGGDVEATGEGDIKLSNTPVYSQLNLKIQFKLADAWAKNGTGAILYQMGRPDGRGYYTANISGTAGNPQAALAN